MRYERAGGWLSRLRGVVTATVTPFDDHGGLDTAAIDRLVTHQADAGVSGLLVGGTTGEFVAMETSERRQALESFLASADARLPVIANVGHVDVGRARGLAEHAAATGADAIAAITPYFLPVTTAAAEAYFRDLARTAPELPFLVYTFPRNTTNAFPADAFGRLLDEPNVAGAKCSLPAMADLGPFLAFEPDAVILSGNESLLAEFVAAGGRAIVSGAAAAYPEVMVRSLDRLLDGTWGQEDAALLADVLRAATPRAPDRLKALLRSRGVDAGAARVRSHVAGDVDADADEARTRVERSLRQLIPGGR